VIAELALSVVRRVERHALLFLAAMALLTVAASFVVVERFAINTDNEDMLSPELPFRQNAIAENNAFPALSDNMLVVVEGGAGAVARTGDRLRERFQADPATFGPVYDPAGDPFFQRNGLLYLEIDELDRLAQRLAEAQPLLATLNADPSLPALSAVLDGLVRARADGDIEIDPTPFVEAVAATIEAATAGASRPLDWQRLMSGGDADATTRRLIVLRPPLNYGGLDPAGAAVDAVRGVADDLAGQGYTARVGITGSPALESEELASVRDGLGVAGLISTVSVAVLLSIGLGSLWRAAAVAVTLAVGLVVTAAFALVAVGPFNLISVAFAVLFVGLGVDFGIHVALRRARQGPEGVARVATTLFLCLLSTAIGFVAFAFTDYDGLAELGIIAAAGMVIAWLLGLTLLPALMAVLPKPSEQGDAAETARRMSLPTKRGAALVLTVAAIIAGVAAIGASDARFDDDPMRLRDAKRPAMSTFLRLIDDGDIPAHGASVLATDEAEETALSERLEALATVSEVRTLAGFVPADQEDKLWLIGDMALVLVPSLTPGGAEATPSNEPVATALAGLRQTLRETGAPGAEGETSYARLAAAIDGWLDADGDPAALERDLLGGFVDTVSRLRLSLEADVFAIDDLPGDVRERFVAADGRRRIEIEPAIDTRDSANLDAFVADVRRAAPTATGAAVVIHEAGKAVVAAFETAVAIAAASVAVVLLAWFRHVGLAVACFLPLMLAALATTAITHWFGMPFNFANVIVLPLLFGIGVDFAIHVVSEIEKPSGAGSLTRRAIVLSALTTIGSFGGIALSGHPGTASMGYLLTLALVACVGATLLVTPAVMALLGRGREA